MISTAEIQLMIELAARAVVDHPESIKVEQIETEEGLTFRIRCGDRDLGKLIGNGGRMARSIRNIVRSAGRAKRSCYIVDIVDNVPRNA